MPVKATVWIGSILNKVAKYSGGHLRKKPTKLTFITISNKKTVKHQSYLSFR